MLFLTAHALGHGYLAANVRLLNCEFGNCRNVHVQAVQDRLPDGHD